MLLFKIVNFFNVLFLLLIAVNYCDQGIIAYSAGKY